MLLDPFVAIYSDYIFHALLLRSLRKKLKISTANNCVEFYLTVLIRPKFLFVFVGISYEQHLLRSAVAAELLGAKL